MLLKHCINKIPLLDITILRGFFTEWVYTVLVFREKKHVYLQKEMESKILSYSVCLIIIGQIYNVIKKMLSHIQKHKW